MIPRKITLPRWCLSPCRNVVRSVLAGVLFAALPAQAAFITDRIEVPVTADKYGQGAVVKRLVSGSRIDILMKDGDYARIRSDDGSSGWVEYRYITTEKPLGLEYLELRSRHKAMQDELAATQARLSEALSGAGEGVIISETELAELRQGAKDTRWMRAEMNKARERAKKLEAELKKARKKSTDKQQASAAEQAKWLALQAQNQDLQDRLAAALLVSDASAAEAEVDDPHAETVTEAPRDAPAGVSIMNENQAGSVSLEWFFGSLLVALIAGGIGGMTWLDRRIREKHGGFRIY